MPRVDGVAKRTIEVAFASEHVLFTALLPLINQCLDPNLARWLTRKLCQIPVFLHFPNTEGVFLAKMIAVADDDGLALGRIRILSSDRCRGRISHRQVVSSRGLISLSTR